MRKVTHLNKLGTNRILILLISIILGISIAFQFKLVNASWREGETTLKTSAYLTRQYRELVDENERLTSEVETLETRLSEIQDSLTKDNYMLELLEEELSYYMLLGGFTDVSGEGIQVVMDNPGEGSDLNLVYQYELLLYLINDLNAAGAEAIEINGERIIGLSEVRNAGSGVVINSIPQYPPFTINAIGDVDTLYGALNQKFGIVSIVRESGFFIEVNKKENLDIDKYSSKPQFDFARTVGE